MNRAIFTTKDGTEVIQELNEGAWFMNKATARHTLNTTDDFIKFRLMGRPFPHWDEQVICEVNKDNREQQ